MNKELTFYLKRVADAVTEEGSKQTYRFVCEPSDDPNIKVTLSFVFKGQISPAWKERLGDGTITDELKVILGASNTQETFE